jgi:hypothetical protein
MSEEEVDDRLSARFGDSDEDDDSQPDMSSQASETDSKSQNAQKAQNIKKEWNVRSFYLDDDLDSDLTTAFKRLDLELSEADSDIDLKKTRHFYPLLVELGLERLEGMDITEVTEQLESEDLV